MSSKKTQTAILLLVLNSIYFWGQDKIIRDDQGFSYHITSPPQRIISLAPNITEILFALGLEDKIVGVTRYCDYPPEALKKEKIGGMIDPNLERIKSLNPDLIIGFRGNPLRILERLRSLAFPVFVFETGINLESVFLIVEKISQITQKKQEAEILVESLRKKYKKIEASLQSVKYRPRAFLLLPSTGGTGLWTCGKESYLNDLLLKAKAVNVTGEIPKNWFNYNREELIYENPEVIIIMSKTQEEFAKAKEWITKRMYLDGLRAVKEDNIYFLDENLASRFGPRLIDAFSQLAHLLHPQNFLSK